MNDCIRLNCKKKRATHFTIKPCGALCNLNCDYCYYLAKKELYPDSTLKMSAEVLEKFTKEFLANSFGEDLSICWQGGEPTLLDISFFEKAVALQKQYLSPGQKIYNSLQTNATRLNEKWCEFLKANNFLVGASLDGPQELHDTYRKTKDSQGSFKETLEGIKLLQKHHVDYNILATVNNANSKKPLEVYRFLRDELGAKYIQFIPIVQGPFKKGLPIKEELLPSSVSAKDYGNFLIKIFEEWLEHDTRHVSVQIFDILLNTWLGMGTNLCVFDSACAAALVLEHNGDIYTCDHFVEPKYKLGNILEDTLISCIQNKKVQEFEEHKHRSLTERCHKCEVQYICQGGCPKNRILTTENSEQQINYLCESYRQFFNHAAKPIKAIAADLSTKVS